MVTLLFRQITIELQNSAWHSYRVCIFIVRINIAVLQEIPRSGFSNLLGGVDIILTKKVNGLVKT
jgi:hypothetical protein